MWSYLKNYKSPNNPAAIIIAQLSATLLSPPLLCKFPDPVLVDFAPLLVLVEPPGPTVATWVVVVGPVIVVLDPPGNTQVQVGWALHGNGPTVPVQVVVWPWHVL